MKAGKVRKWLLVGRLRAPPVPSHTARSHSLIRPFLAGCHISSLATLLQPHLASLGIAALTPGIRHTLWQGLLERPSDISFCTAVDEDAVTRWVGHASCATVFALAAGCSPSLQRDSTCPGTHAHALSAATLYSRLKSTFYCIHRLSLPDHPTRASQAVPLRFPSDSFRAMQGKVGRPKR